MPGIGIQERSEDPDSEGAEQCRDQHSVLIARAEKGFELVEDRDGILKVDSLEGFHGEPESAHGEVVSQELQQEKPIRISSDNLPKMRGILGREGSVRRICRTKRRRLPSRSSVDFPERE